MIEKNSGNIYKFSLDYGGKYAYGEMLDHSDVLSFDGILFQVFNLTSEKKEFVSLEEIKRSGVRLGPVCVNRSPNTKGKGAWQFCGRDENFPQIPPPFKHLRGLLNSNDWSQLSPWYIRQKFDEKSEDIETEYEPIRHLEVGILNHINSVPVKISMMEIIDARENVNHYYNLKTLANKQLFIQVVNTYYSKEECLRLIQQIPN